MDRPDDRVGHTEETLEVATSANVYSLGPLTNVSIDDDDGVAKR